MRNARLGKCCLCGENRELTLEHIPPKSANNRGNFKVIDFICWSQDKRNWKNIRKVRGGLKSRTLCKKCNNNIGGLYAPEYSKLSKKFTKILKGYNWEGWQDILKETYPIRFLKSVLLAFCSLNGPEFAENHQDIRNFIMDKDSKELPPNLTIFMYLNKSKYITRSGINALIENHNIYIVSEYNFPPFGFAMYLGPYKPNRLMDITWFAEYGYDEMADIYLELPILKRYTPFPADYRTELEIMFDIIKGEVVEKFALKK